MAKESALSHSASDDNSENDSEHSAHSNILHKKNQGHTGKGKSKSKSRGTRAENWSVAQTTLLVHLYGNNMLFPELPLKLPTWNIIVAAMVKQDPERKENCSRDQVKALWFKVSSDAATRLPVPDVAIRIATTTTCQVQTQTHDLISTGEISPVRPFPAVRIL